MIGVGITTRNREYVFRKTLQEIRKFLPQSAKLVVVDDNSDKRKHNLKVDEYFYFKQRAGIAKAKNKCIELLENCDDIFLFDDDFYPIKRGWEKIYIAAKDLTGCQHMCFTFDFGAIPEKIEFRILNNYEISYLNSPEQEKYHIEAEKYLKAEKERTKLFNEHETLDVKTKVWKTYFAVKKRVDETQALVDMKHSRELRERYLVTHSSTNFVENQGPLIFKYHDHPNGVMMYISKQCLETIGGFNDDRPIYGGEHGGYSHRAYNAGLTPYPYVDVNDSSKYFCRYEITLATETVLTLEDRASIEDKAKKAFERESRTFDFYDYKPSKITKIEC
jgi:glycosyltransferase involved in cell wall biosynthesis